VNLIKDNKIPFSSFTCNNPNCVNCIAIHTPPGITPVDPIKDLLHLYSDAVCRKDPDQWTNTWCESGIWDLGHDDPVAGKASLRDFWIASMSRFKKVIHTYTNSISELDSTSGQGSGRSYVTEWLIPHEGDPIVLHGFYNDTYIFENNNWLFSKRTLSRHYMGKPDTGVEVSC